jgi:triosephosphate isomerase
VPASQFQQAGIGLCGKFAAAFWRAWQLLLRGAKRCPLPRGGLQLAGFLTSAFDKAGAKRLAARNHQNVRDSPFGQQIVMNTAPYIVGNWKMNGTRAMLAEARAIDRAAARFPQVQVALAPPATLIQAMCEAVQEIGVGAQDCHAEANGAFTGDISAPMLADAGAQFTIVGHSERRAMHGESDAAVRAKAEAAQAAGLSVILCVGETESERDSGAAESVVCRQLEGSVPRGESAAEQLSIAYEPVWAIGTGRVPSAGDVEAMHRAIRQKLTDIYGEDGAGLRILYGGSVNGKNAAELLAVPEVGGALVGGASLTAESFTAIIGAAGLSEEA